MSWAGLPTPREHFLMTYCECCWHVRKDHIEDGPCSNVWEFPGVGLIGCRCQSFERRPAPERSEAW